MICVFSLFSRFTMAHVPVIRFSRRPTSSRPGSSTSCSTSSSCTSSGSTGSCSISGSSTSTRSSADSSRSRGGRCSACKCVISLCLYFVTSLHVLAVLLLLRANWFALFMVLSLANVFPLFYALLFMSEYVYAVL